MDDTGRKAGLAVMIALFLASLALLLVSCAPPTGETEQALAPAAGQDPTPTGSEPARPYPSVPEGIERIEPTQPSPTISPAELPTGLLEDILEDLSSRLEIEPQEIEVARAEAVLWPDGSLGCPQPGEYYTQAAVSGYWINLQVDNVTYDYRASETGHFLLCEGPLPLALPDS